MRPIAIGALARFDIVPDASHLAAASGNTGVTAVSTPSLIGFVEQASSLAIRSCYDTGEASVGTRVEVDHLLPAYAGRRLAASAKVTDVAGRKIGFAVEVEQDGRTVLLGRHDRFVVDLARFLAYNPSHQRPTDSAGASRTITFWFDFHSCASYKFRPAQESWFF